MSVRILLGDCRTVLASLPAASVHCCVTSPPYFGLRDYGMAAQIGLEQTPDAFVAELVAVFRDVRRVLRDDGTLWLNLGDSYFSTTATQGRNEDKARGSIASTKSLVEQGAKTYRRDGCGLKQKDLIGIPWRVAFALQADGWYLRQDIIWSKPNPMPESVRDRCTKAHEYVFLLSRSARYFYDAAAISEAANCPEGPGNFATGKHAHAATGIYVEGAQTNLAKIGARDTRNKRSVWTIATQPYSKAHFATMAPELAETCIKAGCPVGGTVLDPFGGAGTTGLVADRLQRSAILIELNPAYSEIASKRITGDAPLFADVGIAA